MSLFQLNCFCTYYVFMQQPSLKDYSFLAKRPKNGNLDPKASRLPSICLALHVNLFQW